MPDDNRNPMDAMLEIFMAETNDFLTKIEEILIQAENQAGSLRQATPEIFRIMHTIKSSSAMMSLENISKLSHKVEDLFYFLREHPTATIDEEKLIDIVLEAVDFIKRNLDGAQQENPAPLTERIDAYLRELRGDPPTVASLEKTVTTLPERQSPPPADALPDPQLPKEPDDEEEPLSDIKRNKTLTVWFRSDCQMLGLRSLEIQNRVKAVSDEMTSIPEDPTEHEDLVRENGLLLLLKSDTPSDEIVAMIMKSPFVEHVDFAGSNRETPFHASSRETPVRQFVERRRDSPSFGKVFANVEIYKLNNLVDLVSELLVLQMELSQDIEQQDYERSEHAASRMKKTILKLQEAALSTRMLPIRETFIKMNRLVRDMCRKQNKRIQFRANGEDTEVDRGIVEYISSPLMHIVRNAVDHGIEEADDRIAQGKAPVGTIELSAYTEGRNVVIAVQDDGKGIDTAKIRDKAVAMQLITDAEAAVMPPEEINALIFLPGFTTTDEVTEYSGRGVGMDVVNENLKKLSGKVIVHSEKGVGTRIVLKIPLTLAIIDTLILRVNTQMCAIPIGAVRKIFHLDQKHTIRRINGDDMVLLDDECYRILNLHAFYASSDPLPYSEGIMILVGGDTRRFAVFADEIVDRQDVVVKPAPPLFKTIRGIAGCTILGNGQISLILDVEELLIAQDGRKKAQT